MLSTIKSLAKKVVPGKTALPFPEVLNIETSYACNLHCIMCPRHFTGTPQGVFSLELFKERVVPALPKFKYIHLTGWGEPLINKDFAEIVRLCKAAGCWTCVTCNGLLLKSPVDKDIIEAGIDLVNISCDGATKETYEKARGKNTFESLRERQNAFARLARSYEKRPTLQWTFVMMKFNINELVDAIKLAAETGFDKFVAKHLESHTSVEGLNEALWNTGVGPDLTAEEDRKYKEIIELAKKTAREVGINLEVHPRKMAHEGGCLVKPATNLFIDWKGYVSGCCYLTRLDHKPYQGDRPKDDGILGTIEQVQLLDLINGEHYQTFQRDWKEGRVAEACKGCLQVNRMHTTSTD